jgi:phosphoglycerol transferase
VLMKLLGWIWNDYAAVGNLYYLLGFPLTTITSLFVFRRFNVSYGPGLLGSLLYAFLPYHFLRATVHLYLSCYFVVPLMVLVLVWICQGEDVLFRRDKSSKSVWHNGKSWGSAVICILTACGGIYYAFFACGFLLLAGLVGSARQKRWQPLASGGALTGILIGAGLLNISPTLLYAAEHGKNRIAGVRASGESEIYGLKLTQLLLPVGGHRIDELAEINHRYNNNPIARGNENQVATLGVIGSIGFLLLLARSLCGWRAIRAASVSEREKWSNRCSPLPDGRGSDCSVSVNQRTQAAPDATTVEDGLAALNLFALLLATVGGFGSLLDLSGFHNIRAYNRICVYVAFFSLFAIVLLLERIRGRLSFSPKASWIFGGALVGLALLGGLDQCSSVHSGRLPFSWLNGRKTTAQFHSDAAFVKELEESLPHGTMIFQLPYVAFPESPGPTPRMPDCDHFRPYLHSTTLRWSYGAMKGRKTDAWQKWVAEQPLEVMVAALIDAGFGGIYLNRQGFTDNGAALERDLARLLDSRPILSTDETLVFFELTGTTETLKTKT